MDDMAIANPYEACFSLDELPAPKAKRLQAAFIELLAITLILRGCFAISLLSYFVLFGSGLPSHFYASIIVKDAIYCTSALAGGVMLHFRHRIGWWSAMLHWCWYIPYMLSGAAASIGWRIPVYHDPPSLSRSMAYIAIFALPGLAVLLWTPTATACNTPHSKRWAMSGALLLISAIVTVGTNYWADL